jgi:hypothetical protein
MISPFDFSYTETPMYKKSMPHSFLHLSQPTNIQGTILPLIELHAAQPLDHLFGVLDGSEFWLWVLVQG